MCAQVVPLVALLTNDGFPLPIGLCDLIGAAHLAEGHPADNEDHDTWPGAVLSRCLIFVPVAIPSTVRADGKAVSRYHRAIVLNDAVKGKKKHLEALLKKSVSYASLGLHIFTRGHQIHVLLYY